MIIMLLSNFNLFFTFFYFYHSILCLSPTPRELAWGDISNSLGRERLWRGGRKSYSTESVLLESPEILLSKHMVMGI